LAPIIDEHINNGDVIKKFFEYTIKEGKNE
jgi:hypothetical protein